MGLGARAGGIDVWFFDAPWGSVISTWGNRGFSSTGARTSAPGGRQTYSEAGRVAARVEALCMRQKLPHRPDRPPDIHNTDLENHLAARVVYAAVSPVLLRDHMSFVCMRARRVWSACGSLA